MSSSIDDEEFFPGSCTFHGARRQDPQAAQCGLLRYWRTLCGHTILLHWGAMLYVRVALVPPAVRERYHYLRHAVVEVTSPEVVRLTAAQAREYGELLIEYADQCDHWPPGGGAR